MLNPGSILTQMRRDPARVRFAEFCIVCRHFFGNAELNAEDHRIYRLPSIDNPCLSIQNRGGLSHPYQVRRVLKLIARMNKEKRHAQS